MSEQSQHPPMFLELEVNALKAYLVIQLEPICDADPIVLADYIIALLRHNKGEEGLKELCAEQLLDFLHPGASGSFLDTLFAALRTKSFLNPSTAGSSTTPARSHITNNTITVSDHAHQHNASHASIQQGSETTTLSSRRTRDEMEGGDDRLPSPQRAYNHPEDDYTKRGKRFQTSSDQYHHARSSGMGSGYERDRPYPSRREDGDRMNGSADRRRRGDGEGDMGDRSIDQRLGAAPRKRGSGTCSRGAQCPYEHVTSEQQGGMQQHASMLHNQPPNHLHDPHPSFPPPPFGFVPGMMSHPYYPLNGGMEMAPAPSQHTGPSQPVSRPDMSSSFASRRERAYGSGPYPDNRSRPFTKKNIIVVENIPSANLDIGQISAYFKRFGTITNVKLEPAIQKAIVEFSQNAEGLAAYNCPDPIFDNRFIKVYLLKESAERSAGITTTSTTPSSSTFISQQPRSEATLPAAHRASMLPAKPFMSSTAQLLQVQKTQEALLAKQLAEYKWIMEKLSSGLVPDSEKKGLMASLKMLSGAMQQSIQTSQARLSKAAAASSTPAGTMTSPSKETPVALDGQEDGDADPALKAKLEQLQQEATALGVRVPSAAHNGRGGGRGFYGGRGGPRMSAAPRVFNLDLRPKKIEIGGSALASVAADIETHYKNMAEFESIDFSELQDRIIVSFANRWSAEKAMNAPFDVAGLTFQWHVGKQQQQVSTPSSPIPSAISPSSSSMMVDVDAVGSRLMNADDDEDEEEEDVHGEVNWKRAVK